MSGQGWGARELGLCWIGFQALTTVSLGGLPGVEVGKPTHFTVLTKGAGKAKLGVHFAGAAKGEAVRDFEIIDNHDYSYTVKYTAVQQVCPIPSRRPHAADGTRVEPSQLQPIPGPWPFLASCLLLL